MQRLEQLHKRKSRSREESVPSTFPETHERADGGPGKGADELLGEIAIILAEHDRETAHRQLGHLGLETERPH